MLIFICILLIILMTAWIVGSLIFSEPIGLAGYIFELKPRYKKYGLLTTILTKLFSDEK